VEKGAGTAQITRAPASRLRALGTPARKAVEVDDMRAAAEAFPVINDALHRYSEKRRQGSK